MGSETVVEIMTWIDNYIPNKFIYVITYPCPNLSWTKLIKGDWGNVDTMDHVELQLQKYKRGHTYNPHKTRYMLGVEVTNLEEINHVVMGRHYKCIAIDDTENLAVKIIKIMSSFFTFPSNNCRNWFVISNLAVPSMWKNRS